MTFPEKTYPEKLDELAKAMADQKDIPIFDGDFDEAMNFVQQFNDSILSFYNSVVAQGLNKYFPASSKAPEENDKELLKARLIAQDAAATAIDNMNYVCKAYGVEPFADIECGNPEEVIALTKDYRDELLQKGIEMLKEKDKIK